MVRSALEPRSRASLPAACGESIGHNDFFGVLVASRAYTWHMLIDDDYFRLEFNGGDCELEDTDPSHYAYSTRGRVVSVDEDDNKTLAGKFHLYYMDVCAAVNAETSVFDIFDCRADTLDYYGAIFAGLSLTISEELDKLFDFEAAWGNVLILNRLEILPAFRGHNLGLIVIRRLIERFGGGAAYVAMKPFPLQSEHSARDEEDEWRNQLQLPALGTDLRRTTAKLRRHYAKLGFRALKGTPFMFRMGDHALPQPEDLRK
jgi:GNAT superfamily N-acetyltransferase